MNILYCGDRKIEDGLIISILSLLKHIDEELHVYVMTLDYSSEDKHYLPVTDKCIHYLNNLIRNSNYGGFVKKIDASSLFISELPTENMTTRFTPCCMLRLYSDQVSEIPDRVLYLDNDVVCRMNPAEFYYQNIDEYDLAGVLDHYGKLFFRKEFFHMDYLNSGVLLLNMKRIRENGLFASCRLMCRQKKMFMPDQSSINKLAVKHIIRDRRYNEQRKLHKDTVLQHFTTSFRFFPWLHTLTVKPWQTELMHRKLRIHEYDDILNKYQSIRLALQKSTCEEN